MLRVVQEYKQHLTVPHNSQHSIDILIVVREGLVDEFLQHYGLAPELVKVIRLAFLQNI
jgi:hypothetical protein